MTQFIVYAFSFRSCTLPAFDSRHKAVDSCGDGLKVGTIGVPVIMDHGVAPRTLEVCVLLGSQVKTNKTNFGCAKKPNLMLL